MEIKKYKQIRAGVAIYVSLLTSIGYTLKNTTLVIVAVFTGMLFLFFVRSKTKIIIDEREKTIREKAAQMAYSIFLPTLGFATLLLLIPSKSGMSVFANGNFSYLESLGIVFAYLTLLLIAIYSISYHFLNKKFGGGGNEE